MIEDDALLVVGAGGALASLAAADGVPAPVGAVPGGLAAAAASPTGDAVALVTTGGRLLLLAGPCGGWAPLADVDAFGWDAEPVPSRVMPPPQTFDPASHSLSPGDAALSWKGDGTGVATVLRAAPNTPFALRSHAAPSGDLDAVGEGGPALTGCVAWAPDGRHMYAAVAGDGADAPKIALFEPNGMRHGHFDAPGAGAVAALAWSPGAGVLAVSRAAAADAPAAVQLWRRSNWHWYLQVERRMHGAGSVAVAWDGEASLRLHTAWARDAPTTTLSVSSADYALAPTISPAATAAVLDGARMLVTPLARCAVPPPLAAATVALPCPAAAVAVGGDDDSIAVLLADGGVATAGGGGWRADADAARAPLPPAWAAGGHARALVWGGLASLLVVIALPDGGGDALVEVGVAAGTATAPVPAPAPVLALAPAGAGGAALVHTADGAVHEWRDGGLVGVGSLAEPSARVWSLPSNTPSVLGLSTSGALCAGPVVVSHRVRSACVREGGAGGPCVVVVGADDVLRVCRAATLAAGGLAPGALPPPPPPDEDNPAPGSLRADMRQAMRGAGTRTTRAADAAARAVEEGSLIVACPPGSPAVILQMPRGNLETVWPRALVLEACGAALAARDWRRALALASTHRIDLNLIVDYAWPAFVERASDFVAAAGDDGAVCELLGALAPVSTLAHGAAHAWLADADPDAGRGPPSTVDKVALAAGAVRDALAAAPGGERAWLGAVAAAHAALGGLGPALAAVRRAREAEQAESGGAALAPHPDTQALGAARRAAPRAPTPADAGLKYLLLTVPFEKLYAAALGEYDVAVAHMVVLAAGRDPGEHAGDLRRFAAAPAGPERRVLIDTHLGRWDKALAGLVDAGEESAGAALALAAERGLLRELVAALPPGSDRRRDALLAYADALTASSRHEDAALARAAAGDAAGAIAAYAAAGAWRPALALAGRAGWDAQRMRSLAGELADGAAAAGRFADAASLALLHLDDADAAVAWLAAGHEWREGLRAAAAAGRDDLVDTVLAPAAADAAAAEVDDAAADAARSHKYLARYREVRERRLGLEVAVGRAGEGGEADDDDADGAESTASGLSALSAYTKASTRAAPSTAATPSIAPSTAGGRKGGRKGPKKVKSAHRIRAGSAGEEAALAATLAAAAPTSDRLAAVGALTELLVILGHEADARAVQAAVSDCAAAATEAAAYVAANPPPVPLDGAGGPGRSATLAPVAWKWALLR